MTGTARGGIGIVIEVRPTRKRSDDADEGATGHHLENDLAGGIAGSGGPRGEPEHNLMIFVMSMLSMVAARRRGSMSM